MVLAYSQDELCLIIFGRPFLYSIGAEIYFPKMKMFIICAGEILEFSFSKFTEKLLERKPSTTDKVVTPAYAFICSSDAVERYMFDLDEPLTTKEKEASKQKFMQQPRFFFATKPTT
jgi:hypothetical protein